MNAGYFPFYAASFAGRTAGGVHTLSLDRHTGAIHHVSFCPMPWVNYLALAADRKMLYATLRFYDIDQGEGGIAAWAIPEDHIDLCYSAKVKANGRIPCHLTADQSGNWLYWANYLSGSFCQCSLAGRLPTDESRAFAHAGSGSHIRQATPHPHHVCFTPDGSRLCVTDLGANRIFSYPFSEENGIDAKDPDILIMPDGCGPRHLTFDPSGRICYAVNELNANLSEILCFPLGWRVSQTLTTLPDKCKDNSGYSCAAIGRSGDGKHIFVTNRGHHSISHFTNCGRPLRLREVVRSEGKKPMDICFDDESRILLCANQDSDEICAFYLNEKGCLVSAESRFEILSPVCMIPARGVTAQ